ncbi:MAG: MgtC/SapB family protein [Thermoflexales bacterium]|nr:MgtC/SapB family protein [Thermoflexales bacterium]
MIHSYVPIEQILLRVLAALAAGALVGIERESHGRAAGMRTTILVAVAACVAMLISESLFDYVVDISANSGTRPDPARLAQGVLSGMGFLGAGAIVRQGNRVQGVTTAATLWYVSMLGLAFGGGQWLIGAVGVLVALFILVALPRVEGRVKNDWYAVVTVQLALDGPEDLALRQVIEGQGVRVKKADLDYDLANHRKTLRFEVKFKREKVFGLSGRVIAKVAEQTGVQRVTWV